MRLKQYKSRTRAGARIIRSRIFGDHENKLVSVMVVASMDTTAEINEIEVELQSEFGIRLDDVMAPMQYQAQSVGRGGLASLRPGSAGQH